MFFICSQAVIDQAGKEINQLLALSLNENGKSLSLIASSVTPLHLKVLQIFK